MRQTLLLLVLILFAAVAGGCSEHSVERDKDMFLCVLKGCPLCINLTQKSQH